MGEGLSLLAFIRNVQDHLGRKQIDPVFRQHSRDSLTRKKSPQKFVFGASVALAIIVLGTIGVVLVREYLIVDLASSLILRDKPADSVYWKLTETRRGHLIQATSGRYRGWYLDVDKSLAPLLIGEGLENGTDRFIVLSRRARSSAYWNLIEVGNGHRVLQSAGGTTENEYIDIAGLDVPDRGDGYLFARNLLIAPSVQFRWSVKETEKGTTIQAIHGMSFTDWYLAVDDSVAPNETVTVKADSTLRMDMEVRTRLERLNRHKRFGDMSETTSVERL